jgi:hypothetical protein
MPLILPPESNLMGEVRSLAERGQHEAQLLVALMNGTNWVQLTAGAEAGGGAAANSIRITGQVMDQDGQPVLAVRDVFVKSMPVSGAGTMTVGASGTLKAGSGSKEIWIQSNSSGVFQFDVLNAAVEDNLVIANLDNGETETLKITFA